MRNTPYTTAGLLAAVRALREQGHDVDENNNTHVSAYMALREAPPHGVTGERLVERIQWLQMAASASVGERVTHPSRLDFWAVPRRNFPTGLPAFCRGYSCSSEDVAGCDCPNAEFFFIDQAIPRSVLGPDVRTCSCTVTTTGLGPPATGDASATGDAPTTGDAARYRQFEDQVHSIWAEFGSNPAARDRRRFAAQREEAGRRSRRAQIADEAERELAETAARHIADEARYLADEGARAATGEPLALAAGDGPSPATGDRAARQRGFHTGYAADLRSQLAEARSAHLREYGAAQRFAFASATIGGASSGETVPPATGVRSGNIYKEPCDNGDCGQCDVDLSDLFDEDNHNPDFEHDEVPQWALDEWEAQTRDRQEEEEEYRHVEEEEAAGEAVAVAPAVVEAAAETNHPPASADIRYAVRAPCTRRRVRASPSATGDASATGVDECDTDEEALAAALADEDKWTWGSRVQWWQSDAEWTDNL